MASKNERVFLGQLLFTFLVELCPMSIPRRINIDCTQIFRRYVEDLISMNFHFISTYFFEVISLIEKFTSFSRIFFGVITMVQKSTFFPRTFFGAISLVEISTFFSRTFFDVISMVKKSTLFPRTFINVISLVKKSKLFSLTLCHVIFDGQKIHVVCTYFFQQNFDGKAKIRRCFWLSCKLMKTFEKVFLCQ